MQSLLPESRINLIEKSPAPVITGPMLSDISADQPALSTILWFVLSGMFLTTAGTFAAVYGSGLLVVLGTLALIALAIVSFICGSMTWPGGLDLSECDEAAIAWDEVSLGLNYSFWLMMTGASLAATFEFTILMWYSTANLLPLQLASAVVTLASYFIASGIWECKFELSAKGNVTQLDPIRRTARRPKYESPVTRSTMIEKFVAPKSEVAPVVTKSPKVEAPVALASQIAEQIANQLNAKANVVEQHIVDAPVVEQPVVPQATVEQPATCVTMFEEMEHLASFTWAIAEVERTFAFTIPSEEIPKQVVNFNPKTVAPVEIKNPVAETVVSYATPVETVVEPVIALAPPSEPIVEPVLALAPPSEPIVEPVIALAPPVEEAVQPDSLVSYAPPGDVIGQAVMGFAPEISQAIEQLAAYVPAVEQVVEPSLGYVHPFEEAIQPVAAYAPVIEQVVEPTATYIPAIEQVIEPIAAYEANVQEADPVIVYAPPADVVAQPVMAFAPDAADEARAVAVQEMPSAIAAMVAALEEPMSKPAPKRKRAVSTAKKTSTGVEFGSNNVQAQFQHVSKDEAEIAKVMTMSVSSSDRMLSIEF
jgi:hypothetical protein